MELTIVSIWKWHFLSRNVNFTFAAAQDFCLADVKVKPHFCFLTSFSHKDISCTYLFIFFNMNPLHSGEICNFYSPGHFLRKTACITKPHLFMNSMHSLGMSYCCCHLPLWSHTSTEPGTTGRQTSRLKDQRSKVWLQKLIFENEMLLGIQKNNAYWH